MIFLSSASIWQVFADISVSSMQIIVDLLSSKLNHIEIFSATQYFTSELPAITRQPVGENAQFSSTGSFRGNTHPPLGLCQWGLMSKFDQVSSNIVIILYVRVPLYHFWDVRLKWFTTFN